MVVCVLLKWSNWWRYFFNGIAESNCKIELLFCFGLEVPQQPMRVIECQNLKHKLTLICDMWPSVFFCNQCISPVRSMYLNNVIKIEREAHMFGYTQQVRAATQHSLIYALNLSLAPHRASINLRTCIASYSYGTVCHTTMPDSVQIELNTKCIRTHRVTSREVERWRRWWAHIVDTNSDIASKQPKWCTCKGEMSNMQCKYFRLDVYSKMMTIHVAVCGRTGVCLCVTNVTVHFACVGVCVCVCVREWVVLISF